MPASALELGPLSSIIAAADADTDAGAIAARRSTDVSSVPINTLLGSVVLPESGRNGARSVSSRRCTCAVEKGEFACSEE